MERHILVKVSTLLLISENSSTAIDAIIGALLWPLLTFYLRVLSEKE
jgi:hypothetical protein